MRLCTKRPTRQNSGDVSLDGTQVILIVDFSSYEFGENIVVFV